MGDLTGDGLRYAFPRWEFWTGVNGLKYARLMKSSPPQSVRGEDYTDLRDAIRRWEADHD